MPEPEPLIRLDLNAPPAPSVTKADNLPAAESLQFRRAEPAPDQQPDGPRSYACAMCNRPISGQYYQSGQAILCPICVPLIEKSLGTPPTPVLVKSILYGLGAAVAGCLLYSFVLSIFGQIALVALLIGYMVGKAMRHGAGGRGSRPQQIAAVLLTYLAMTMPVALLTIYKLSTNPAANVPHGILTWLPLLPKLVVMGLLFPITMSIRNPARIFTILIIGYGMVRAWQMTAKPKFLLTGPFETFVT